MGVGPHISTGMTNTPEPVRGPELDRRITAQAETNHGLVRRIDMRTLQTNARMERWRVDRGSLVLVVPGVWRVAGAPVTWEQQLTAGLEWLGPVAVVSGLAVAALSGYDGFPPGPVEFTVPRSARWRAGPFIVHTTVKLELIDRAMVRGYPVTSAARTIIDLAGRDITAARLADAIDSATRGGLVTAAFLSTRMAALRPGRPRGIRRLDELVLDAGGHSYLERRFLRLVRESGLPRPRCQVVHRRDGKTVARVDFDFVPSTVVVEVSGRRGHVSDSDRDKDTRRRNELQRQGRRVLEFTTAHVLDDPEYVVRTLRENLEEAGELTAARGVVASTAGR